MPNILMPALSPTMEEGKLSKWLKKVGDNVKSGDVLAEIETDKATMEVEAVDEGPLTAILVAEGTENVRVNTPIAVIGQADAAPVPKPAAAAAESSTPTPVAAPANVSAPAPDTEIPEGTEMVTMTVREAIRAAMSEEMRRDKDVFLMGEEVGEYQGAYKISQGMLEEFGPQRVIDTPITEHGFTGIATGAAFAGLKPIVEFMTFNSPCRPLTRSSIPPPKRFICPAARWAAPSCSAAPMARRPASEPSTPRIRRLVFPSPGLKVVMPYSAADAKGLMKSAIRDPTR
jgi:pyruvate dehydrogenase E1 component beta subunit